MAINVSSTSDSQEAVNAANGVLAEKAIVEEKSASAEKPGEIAGESETTEPVLEETQDAVTTSTEDEVEEELEAKDTKEAPKKKGGFQKRIERFQKQLSQKDQEIELWKKQALATKPEAKQEMKAQDKPQVIGKPKADDFESHESYVEALTDWKLEARDKEKEQKAQEVQVKSENQRDAEAFQSRLTEFQKTADDFDELMEDVKIDVPYHVQRVFLKSEVGPALMYELAKNQKELERISKLPAIDAALELGRLETKFLKSAQSTPSKETKTTKAPTPVSPVGSKGSAIKKSIDDPNLSQREYERLRAEQEKAARA